MFSINDLSISYDKQAILENVTADAAPGELTVIVGPNGSGKTTLLRGLARLLPSDCAGMYLDEKPVPEEDAWFEMISYIPAEGGIISILTVEEQLYLHCRLSGESSGVASRRTGGILSLLDLTGHRNHRGNELSTGLTKRLQIGLGIVRNVPVYFIDEPFTGLDAESVGTMQGILELLIKKGKYVLIASHAVRFLKKIKATVWELGDGRLAGIYSGSRAADKIEELSSLQASRLHQEKLEWIR